MAPKPKFFTGPKSQQPTRFVRSQEKQTARGLTTATSSVKIDPRPTPRAVPNPASSSTAGYDSYDASLAQAEEESMIPEDINHPQPKRRAKAQKDYLQEFLSRQPDILRFLMARYARPQDVCTSCKRFVGRWRCRDCCSNAILCRGCMRRSHQSLPFHSVEFWTGKYFRRSSLAETGVRLVITHASGMCDALAQRLAELELFETQADARKDKSIVPSPAADHSTAAAELPSDSMEIDDVPDLRELEDDELSDYGDDFDAMVDIEDDPPSREGFKYEDSANTTIPTVDVGSEPLPEDEDDWEDEEYSDSLPHHHTKATDDAFGNPVVTVIHSNGFHSLPVVQCYCQGPGHSLEEFINARYLPASYDKIKTVATFHCLEDFRLSNLEAKTSAYQYHNLLRRRTDPSAPNTTTDRYQILRRLSRQWRIMKKAKLHGFADHPQDASTGDLALFCPTCPQEGVNLPENWSQLGPSNLYNRLFVADGNFTADHMKLKGDEGDVWLLDGQGIMAQKEPYKVHLGIAKDIPTDAPCERNFRAVNLANMVSSAADVTGVAAVACARHGCFAPGAVVDLQKGERQMNVDWAFAQALRNTNISKGSKVLLLYDIWCQYSVNLGRRVDQNPFLNDIWRHDLEIDGGIGLFHVHGHRDECLYRFATYYIPGASIVDGEVLETLWSILNQVSRSTRSASLAHRAEILDDHMNDNNWKKLLNMLSVLKLKHANAITSCEEWDTYLHGLSTAAGPEAVIQWTRDIEAAEEQRSDRPAAMDIMHTNRTLYKAPSRADVHLRIAEGSRRASTAAAKWLNAGLTLEQDQLDLQVYIQRLGRDPTKSERLDIAAKRDRLRVRVHDFQKEALTIIDDVSLDHLLPGGVSIPYFDLLDDIPGGNSPFGLDAAGPERTRLALPSAFPKEYIAQLASGELRELELDLRRGQANDILESIRMAIGQKSFQYTANLRIADKKTILTRARASIQDLTHLISKQRRLYLACRQAMINLGLPEPELANMYRPIADEDLQTSTAVIEPNTPGLSRQQLSWIWTVGRDTSVVGDPIKEFQRVHWLRARAQKNRWHEEKLLTHWEMVWTTRFFLSKVEYWKSCRRRCLGKGDVGGGAYSARQIHFWKAFAARANLTFGAAFPTFGKV